jgi:hypothetical protein
MQQKAFLDTDSTGNTTYRDPAGVAVLVVGTDDQALEDLDTLFVAFTDFLMHFNCVTASYIDDG